MPLPVLLAVAYNESLWEQHGGRPSTSGGYGIMHLTHVDRLADGGARGDGIARWVRSDPALHTLDQAAQLVREPRRVLERNPAQNIRGGAALLAELTRRITGTDPSSIAQWYGAVAAYSRAPDLTDARTFANTVFATIRTGASRVTSGGQLVRLAPTLVSADVQTIRPLHLRAAQTTAAECPKSLACRFAPAAYRQNSSSNPADYGNYDVANRPADALTIRYIVIHDTEGSYGSAINSFQDPHRYASANYVIRSADGQVTQMVPDEDIAWHCGDYWFNMHSIGIEHEGVAVQGATWYGEQLYQSSARLLRYLAHRYHVPLDRAHIIGHDQVPGYSPATQASQHWDPGPYWDWQHYMDLLNAVPMAGDADSPIVMIAPDSFANEPPVSYCTGGGSCPLLAAQPANFVYMRTAPDPSAPLVSDRALEPNGSPGTTEANDWGDKAVYGQQFALVDREGDWAEIDYGGQPAWLYDPGDQPVTMPVDGQLVTPRPGKASIPVYGAAYPEKSVYPKWAKNPEKIIKLQYAIPAGQSYVLVDQVTSDYNWSPTQAKHVVIQGKTQYDVISFNHRLALVRAGDVVIQPSTP